MLQSFLFAASCFQTTLMMNFSPIVCITECSANLYQLHLQKTDSFSVISINNESTASEYNASYDKSKYFVQGNSSVYNQDAAVGSQYVN